MSTWNASKITGTSSLKSPLPSLERKSSASGEVVQPWDEKSSTTTAPTPARSSAATSAMAAWLAESFEEERLPKQAQRPGAIIYIFVGVVLDVGGVFSGMGD